MSFDLHPDVQPLIAARASLPQGQNLAEDRQIWSEYARANAVPPPAGMIVENRMVPGRDGNAVPIRIYTPAGAGAKPALLYFHGGGFVKGDCDTSDTNGWGLAAETGAVVISVEYRLAPEHPYPAALHDCVAALEHVAKNPGDYGVDASRIGVSGDSAGGNLAAAVALWARDHSGPALKCQGLIYPCLTDKLEFDSYQRNADAPGLTTSNMRGYWDKYLGEAISGASTDPLATPMVAADLTGLPPAYVLVAEFDPLLDDGLIYAAKLMGFGVETGYYRAEGMIHGFARARITGAHAAKAFNAMTDFLRAKLHG
jgi:acetyl esterase